MNFKFIITFIFALFLILLLVFYFTPLKEINFATDEVNTNFSIEGDSMQFYPNLRFPSSDISYKIEGCSLQRQNDMEYAFNLMGNLTSLKFYPISNNEEISIGCEDKPRIEEHYFIAGEGGPTNITVSGNFNVITHGEILLLRESKCPKPNVGLHELLHVLGFEHSTNPQNILYNITNCEQRIGDDVVDLINELYLTPSLPDLLFVNASAIMSGRFLTINMTVLNGGLKDSDDFKINIYISEKSAKEFDFMPLEIGTGRIIYSENIFISQLNVDEIELSIDSSFDEVDKTNNKIKLKIK